MRYIFLTLFAAILMTTGCDKEAQSIEEREERDPFVKSGQEFMDEQKWDQAIESFNRALEKEPRMARPHLDLAIIYQQHKINYIHAIYHYDRYLELRPNAEKAEFINQQKLKVAQALANTLINASPEVKQVVKERNELLQQNKELQRQLTAARGGEPAPTTRQRVATQTRSAPAPAASSGKHQIYHVVSGDTLTKIASQFYGDSSKWDIILDANSDRLSSPSALQIGQTLVIPVIEN